MIKYQYQLIRYIHDQFTREFVNVGIVLFSPEENFLRCRVINRFVRLSGFFGEVNGHFLLGSLKHFEGQITSIAENLPAFLNDKKTGDSLEAITGHVLPKDDSALQLTNVYRGVELKGEIALEDLYSRIIEKYNTDSQPDKHTDQEAWKKAYKNYFDKYGLTKNLKKHEVTTLKDTIKFDKAWKNGIWHCYQSLAFDLRREDAIKGKAYKWSGIVRELETSKEALKLYFLTTSPVEEHTGLEVFIQDTLLVKSANITVSIVEEKEAEKFALKVRKEMEESNIFEEPF